VYYPIGALGLIVMPLVEEDLPPEPELYPLLLNLEAKYVVKLLKNKAAIFNHAQ